MEEIEREGLRKVIPLRVKATKRPLTMNCLSNNAAKPDHEKWQGTETPNKEQKKRILAMAIAMGAKIAMTNHTYSVGDQFYRQTSGGPIGLELTGVLARIFMMNWDQRYLQKVKENGKIQCDQCELIFTSNPSASTKHK